MNQISIPEKKIIIDVPAGMDELTPRQYKSFIKRYHDLLSGKIDLHTFKILITVDFLEIRGLYKYHISNSQKQMYICDGLNALSTLFDFLIDVREEEGKLILTPSLGFSKNYIPRYRFYKGPEDALSDISFGELMLMIEALEEYSKTGSEDSLNLLVSALYRPVNVFTGRKPAYKREKAEKRAKKIAKWPIHIRYGIFLFASACYNIIRNNDINVNGRSINLGVVFNKQDVDEDSPDNGLGLLGVLYNLAETHVFGDMEQTAQTNAYMILLRLYQMRTDNLDFKRKMKRNDKPS